MRELRTDPDKSKWYRIEERETVKHVTSLPAGAKITTARQIARVGYYFQPGDAPDNEIVEMRVGTLAERLKREIFKEEVQKFIDALGIYDTQFWKRIDYLNRGRWQRSQSAKMGNVGNLRVAWYEDYIYREPLTIIRAQFGWQGEYYAPRPGRGWGYSEDDYDEGDPGGLSNRVYLRYYVCEEWNGSIVYVHPLDAQEVKS